MKLNPQITIHTLKAAYGEAAGSGAFPDVLAQAMSERQARIAKRRQDEAKAAPPVPKLDLASSKSLASLMMKNKVKVVKARKVPR